MVLHSWVLFTLKQAESYNVFERLGLCVYWSHTILNLPVPYSKRAPVLEVYFSCSKNLFPSMYVHIHITYPKTH
jgi:hypothetical protein